MRAGAFTLPLSVNHRMKPNMQGRESQAITRNKTNTTNHLCEDDARSSVKSAANAHINPKPNSAESTRSPQKLEGQAHDRTSHLQANDDWSNQSRFLDDSSDENEPYESYRHQINDPNLRSHFSDDSSDDEDAETDDLCGTEEKCSAMLKARAEEGSSRHAQLMDHPEELQASTLFSARQNAAGRTGDGHTEQERDSTSDAHPDKPARRGRQAALTSHPTDREQVAPGSSHNERPSGHSWL